MPTNLPEKPSTDWTFLSNHAHVLLVIAGDPEVRLRDVATMVGITERALQRIVTDLELGGYLVRERMGRRNRYQLRPDVPLRHPIEHHKTVAELIALVLSSKELEELPRAASSPRVP